MLSLWSGIGRKKPENKGMGTLPIGEYEKQRMIPEKPLKDGPAKEKNNNRSMGYEKWKAKISLAPLHPPPPQISMYPALPP